MRLRFRFAKLGKVRWTSHRDVARMWERAFRRVELPLAYTAGFSPRPKVSFGLALPTGYESVAEYLDVDLDPSRVDGLDVDALPPTLSAALPAGVDVTAAAVIDARTESLQHEVTSCDWSIAVAAASVAETPLRELAAQALAAPTLVVTRERKGRAVEEDVRPAILSIDVVDECRLRAELATQPRALRPSELLAALAPGSGPAPGLVEVSVRRDVQWIVRSDGARSEPLALAPDALADANRRDSLHVRRLVGATRASPGAASSGDGVGEEATARV
jgi:radical SAM-linked protein